MSKAEDRHKLFCCCPKGQEPSWIFVYENDEVYAICDEHFESLEHRFYVTPVINFETREMYSPENIFKKV